MADGGEDWKLKNTTKIQQKRKKITKHTWTQTKEKPRDILKSNEVVQRKRHSVVKAAH